MRELPIATISESDHISLPNPNNWLRQISLLISDEQQQLLELVRSIHSSLKEIYHSKSKKERANNLKILIKLCQKCINEINQEDSPLSESAERKESISYKIGKDSEEYAKLSCNLIRLFAVAEFMLGTIVGCTDRQYLKLILNSEKPVKDYHVSPDYYDPNSNANIESRKPETLGHLSREDSLAKEGETTLSLPTSEECKRVLLAELKELYIKDKYKIEIQLLLEEVARCLDRIHDKNKTKQLDNLLDICSKITEKKWLYNTSLSRKVKGLLQIPSETIIIKRGLLPLNERERKRDRRRTLYLKPSTTASSYRIFQSNGQFLKFKKNEHGELCLEPYCRIGDTLNEASQESTIVVDEKGRWFAGCTRVSTSSNGNFHHSSFASGRSVKFAGVIKFSTDQHSKVSWLSRLIYFFRAKLKPKIMASGMLITISNQSGHYLTPPDTTRDFIKEHLPKASLSGIEIIKIMKPDSKRNCFDEFDLREFIVDDTQVAKFSPANLPGFFNFWFCISNSGFLSRRNKLLRFIDKHHKEILSKQTGDYQHPNEYKALIELIIISIDNFINHHPNSKRLYALRYAKWLWLDHYKRCFSDYSEPLTFIMEDEKKEMSLKDLLLPSSVWKSISSGGIANRRNTDLRSLDELYRKLLNEVSKGEPYAQLEQTINELSRKIDCYIENCPAQLKLAASLNLLKVHCLLYLKKSSTVSAEPLFEKPTLWNQSRKQSMTEPVGAKRVTPLGVSA